MKRRPWSPDEQARLADMYAIGMPVSQIAERLGRNPVGVKSAIRHYRLERDPSRYAEGVALLASDGETFRRTHHPDYWVSDGGRVLAMGAKPGTFLAPDVDRDGYLRVCIARKHHLVHRLVAFAFLGEPAVGQLVAHNNGARADNRADNLRWATQAENVADKVEHGTEQKG